jgi:hypothetical protein
MLVRIEEATLFPKEERAVSRPDSEAATQPPVVYLLKDEDL